MRACLWGPFSCNTFNFSSEVPNLIYFCKYKPSFVGTFWLWDKYIEIVDWFIPSAARSTNWLINFYIISQNILNFYFYRWTTYLLSSKFSKHRVIFSLFSFWHFFRVLYECIFPAIVFSLPVTEATKLAICSDVRSTNFTLICGGY